MSIGARAPVLVLAVLVAVPGAVIGQEDVSLVRPMAADAAIKVWNGSGSVRVEGWDRDSLAVSGRLDEAGGGRFFIRAEAEVAKLGVEGDQDRVGGDLVVRVPAGATVWVRTTTADVFVVGLTGDVDIHTAAGNVDADGRPATFYAESVAGDLRLHIKTGIARARAGTGRITFTGTVDDLALRSVSGGLDITAPELRRGRFTTVDGTIDFEGDVRSGGALTFETHSGDIGLTLPASLDADVRASTFEGALEVGFPGVAVPVQGAARRSVAFEVGTGGAEVEVRSYTGSITLMPR